MELLPNCRWKFTGTVLSCLIAIAAAQAQDVVILDSLAPSNRSGIENILQGSVAGLRIKDWSGTPGTQSTINLRGLSIDPTDESTLPLILINGVPLIASPSKVTAINPLSYYTPEQIDRIEIIKEIDQLAAYGVQAPNGAINIIIKEGKNGPLHVSAKAFAGADFFSDFDFRKDAFYNFNTIARKEVYSKGSLIHEQNAMIDGGGEFGSYLFGFNNYRAEGAVKGVEFGRQSLFINAKYNITPKFTAHFYNNLALANRAGRYAGEYSRHLDLPVIDDESFFMDDKKNVALLSSVDLSYQFTPHLKINSRAGVSYEGASRDLYIPSNLLKGNIYAESAAYKRQLITINTFLSFQHAFSDRLKLDMTLGNEIRNTDDRLSAVNGERSMEEGGSDYVKVVTGYNANQTDALSNHVLERLISFYGLWKWSYKDDLSLNMVLRTDGSSLYKKKWALYPALGLRYGLKNTVNVPVTLNASVGKTGVLSGPEVYRGELGAYGDYYGGNELGIGQLYPPFPQAKSVDVYQVDVGLSYEISKLFTVDASYFNKTYKDFTYRRYLPNITGIDYEFETGGALGLSGVEVTLDGRWIRKKDLVWTTGINLSFYRNKIKELPAAIENTSFSHLQALSTGDAISSIIAYEGQQQKIIGNSDAKHFGGLNNTLRFRNISTSFTFTYASGVRIATESFSSRYTAGMLGDGFPLNTAETPYYFIETDQDGNRIYQGIQAVENGNFIRLSKAAVSYHLGPAFKHTLSLKDVELFVQGDNLVTFTKYRGINPEENLRGIRKADLSDMGIPLSSSVVLGLKLVF